MKQPKFTVTLSNDEMSILAMSLLKFVSQSLNDASACAAESLIDKLLDEQVKQMKLWNK